jgi:magnesium-transporting ATPase (P-type)
MPEHKFQIVDRIRLQGHVTGMTGDGAWQPVPLIL